MLSTDQVRVFAEQAYGGLSYGQFPYTFHLTEVVLTALKFGHTDDVIVQSCLLHDLLEDTDITQDDLRKVGVDGDVITIVECVTDGPGANLRESKATMYPKCLANSDAVVVKLCDRIANVEMSIKTKSKQFRMYLKEQKEFKEKLYTPGVCEDMWNYLDSIIRLPLGA